MNRPILTGTKTLFGLLCTFLMTSCAQNRPLDFAQPIVLQDALPDHAAFYLVRAPHDGGHVELRLNGLPVARLPSQGYTTIQVREGQHRLTAITTGSAADGSVDYTLEARPGERHFYYLVQPTDVRSPGRLPIFTGKLLLLPGYGGAPVPAGSRVWQEMNESDAQGMLGISKLVMPVQVIY